MVNNQQYLHFFEEAPDTILVFNQDWNIVDINFKGCQLLEYSKKEIVKLNIIDIAHNIESLPSFINFNIGQSIKNNRILKSKSGKLVPFEVTSKLISNGHVVSVCRDISDNKEILISLKETENKLFESREQLRLFIDHTHTAVAMFDTKMNYINCSQKWINDWSNNNNKGSKVDYVGKNHYDLFPDVTKEWKRIHKKSLKGEILHSNKEHFTNQLGENIWLKWESHPWYRSSKKIGGIMIFTEIITDQVKTQEALKESEAQLGQIIDLVPHLIFAKDDKGNIILANKAFADSYGTTPEYIAKYQKLPEYSIPDSNTRKAFLKTDLDVINNNKSITTPLEVFIDTQGNTKYLITTKIPYNAKDNSGIKILGISADITERIKFEEKIKKSEENLDFYFSKSLDGFYIMETKYPFSWDKKINKNKVIKKVFDEVKIVKINDSMVKQYNGTLEGMMGFSLADFFKHDLTSGYNVIIDLLDNGKQQHITREKKLDGSEFWVEGDYVCLYNDKGEVRGLFGFQRDITDRIVGEADLKKITEDLIKSNNELQQFAYLTSHDLRAPVINLNSLLNFYNKENLQDKDNPIIIEKIEDSVKQLQSTLSDLVNIVALKKQSIEDEQSIYFSKITNEVKTAMHLLLDQVSPTITVDFQIRTIKYPKTHLYSIIQNLLSNAVKYRSSNRHLKIGIKTYKHKEYTCLEISDNGQGINMKKHGDKLFGIYQRFHNVPNSKGLGLYIVKTQVEMMGGFIEVKSIVNKGTTFSVFLKSN